MPILISLPAILSFLLLAAHFLHQGESFAALISVGICVLLFSRDRWVIRIVQTILAMAAVEWLFTTYHIVQQRQMEHRDWIRAAAILIVLAVFNIAAAAILRLRREV